MRGERVKSRLKLPKNVVVFLEGDFISPCAYFGECVISLLLPLELCVNSVFVMSKDGTIFASALSEYCITSVSIVSEDGVISV